MSVLDTLSKPEILISVAVGAACLVAAGAYAFMRKRRDRVGVRLLPHVDVSAYNSFPIAP